MFDYLISTIKDPDVDRVVIDGLCTFYKEQIPGKDWRLPSGKMIYRPEHRLLRVRLSEYIEEYVRKADYKKPRKPKED